MRAESNYIKNLIAQGENEQLDFKFEISDSKKIARTLSAFCNTKGGKLLLGVKDNGSIAGVRSDEEYYMMEAGAKIYCKPEIDFTIRNWIVDGRTVVEVDVRAGKDRPYYAKNDAGEWKVYIRVADQNLLANNVLMKVWKRQNDAAGTFIRYTEIEKLLFEYFEHNEYITLSKFVKLAKLKYYKAENVLVNLMCLKIIDIVFTEKQVIYRLKDSLD